MMFVAKFFDVMAGIAFLAAAALFGGIVFVAGATPFIEADTTGFLNIVFWGLIIAAVVTVVSTSLRRYFGDIPKEERFAETMMVLALGERE